MGIMDFVEKAAGAIAADKALEAVDPDAGLLAKGAAAVAGFEGVAMLKDRLSGGENAEDAPAADNDQDQDQSGS